MLPIRTILHPTDFSKCSHYAFRIACALARDYGARLIVLHVAQPPLFVTYGEMEKMLQQPNGYGQELENRLRQLQPAVATIPVEHCLKEGDPVAAILGAADENQCDLILMGTHGRRGLDRLLMGSVAEHVSRRAACPVLTVRTPIPETPPPESVAVIAQNEH